MPYYNFRNPDGTIGGSYHALIRGRNPPAPCAHCGCISSKLCDGPVEGRTTGDRRRKTCDKPICTFCAKHVGEDRDYCKDHAHLAGVQTQIEW